MDVPVVLSHQTAYLLHHASGFLADEVRSPALLGVDVEEYDYELEATLPEIGLYDPTLNAVGIAERIRHFLVEEGVRAQDLDELGALDILVPYGYTRPGSHCFHPHVMGRLDWADHLVHVARGLFVVDSFLLYCEASSWMTPLEQIEFGYEVFGSYTLDDASPEGYREHEYRLHVADFRQFLGDYAGMPGAHRAARTLSCIKENARSPMEGGLAMMNACRVDDGGLGFRRFTLNERVKVPEEFRRYTSLGYVEIDVYAAFAGAGMEYDGWHHGEGARRAHDAERSVALSLLGKNMMTITGPQFGNQLQLHRALNHWAFMVGVEVPQTTEFQRKQNSLREFVIRRWRQRL